MSTWHVLAVAVALGCDAFAVGLGVGARFHQPRQVFRLSFHFGLFQFLMPLIGWWGGQAIVDMASRWAPWIAAAVLAGLGLHMIWEAVHPGEEEKPNPADPTKGLTLIALAVATSIDALGVGFSLGLMKASVLWPAVIIGLVAVAMTFVAMRLGRGLGSKLGRRAGALGGVILIAIAVKMIW